MAHHYYMLSFEIASCIPFLSLHSLKIATLTLPFNQTGGSNKNALSRIKRERLPGKHPGEINAAIKPRMLSRPIEDVVQRNIYARANRVAHT